MFRARGRNNVSWHSRRGQGKGAGSDKSLAKGHLRRDKVYSCRSSPGWKRAELSRARWLQCSGGRSGAPGKAFWGEGVRRSTLEIGDGRELAARRMQQLSGRAGYWMQGKGCAVATPVDSASVRPAGLGLGRSNVSKVGIFR